MLRCVNKYICVGYPTSNVNISNCPRVRASHPHHDITTEVLYINNQQRKNLYQRLLGSAPYCRGNKAGLLNFLCEVWNKMWRGAAWADSRFDSIVYWRWLQWRNEECRPYSLQLVTYRYRCLGINTAIGRHESHRTYLIPHTVLRTKMSNELSFTQMTHTLSLCVYYASTCWEICRNCLCGVAPYERAICLPIHEIAAGHGPVTSLTLPFIHMLSGIDTIRQWKEDLD